MDTPSTADINQRHFPGHLAMLCATIMWGAMSPIAKGVMQEGEIGGLPMAAIRIGGGTLLFLLASLLPRRLTGDVAVERRDFAWLFLASIIMISANQGLFIIGIQYTTPIDTTVMCTLTPVFTLLLAAMFINQPLTWLKVTGVVIGLAGALIMAFTQEETGVASNPLLGATLCIAAQICAAVYYVFFLKIINRYPPFTVMKWMFLFSAVTFVPAMSLFLADVDWSNVSAESYWSIAYVIVFPTFIAYLLIPFSQRRLKPTVISMYAYLQPVVAAVIAAAMGLAVFGWVRIFSTLMIFAGVALVSFSVRPKAHHAPTPAK